MMLTMRRMRVIVVGLTIASLSTGIAVAGELELTLRSRGESSEQPRFEEVTWDLDKTALIICDMWDAHWCESATRRVAEMAGPLNATIKAARASGVLIIHAPSMVTDFYENSPQRKRAQNAAVVALPDAPEAQEGWETGWCLLDRSVEGQLPIDDSDGGCSCDEPKCVDEKPWPWMRQIETIELHPEDALSDSGKEIWYLMEERCIENVIITGVHLNMCVLGRPFGIRQMVRTGKNVVLMRDMTDTMYDPSSAPEVDHFTGTDLMIAHVERHWSPSIVSTEFSGKAPFRFVEDLRLETDSD
ncbi:cysteine hydrolase [Opitutaceae bacterium]|nr:cysteine hydrolase [Opitutaceae bacterium]